MDIEGNEINMEKILTVSIAAYNVEKYIRKTLESCINPQIMDEIEVIVVNDGSKDNTANIAKEYVDNWPNTFKLIDKENGGYGSTVNASIKVAKGKYFRLLDGDDWFDTNELVKFVKILKESEEDMIIARFKRVFEEDGHEEIRDESKGIDFKVGKFNDIKTKDWFTMHATTYRTKILQENEIHLTEHCFYTDQEYDLLPLKYVDTIHFVDNIVYCYRIGRGEQSVSLAGLEKHYAEQTIVLKRLYKEFKNFEKKETTKDIYIYNYLLRRTRIQIFIYLAISESKQHKKELKEFIEYLRDEEKIIFEELCRTTRTIRVLVKSKYLLYPVFHITRKREYKY